MARTLWDTYQRLSHPLILPLLTISRRGLRVDLERRKAAQEEYRALGVTLRGELDVLVGKPLDPLSPKQIMDWVYKDNGVKAVTRMRKRVGGEKVSTPTVDEEAINDLCEATATPPHVKRALEKVLEIRACTKLLSTYLEAPLDPDGRLRCSYVISGTKTGRLASRESPFGTGTNLQNVPRSGVARQMVIPDPGCVFVNADLSQAEARVVAYLAGEDRLIDLFNSGRDIHKYNASLIYRKPEADITPQERTVAKKSVHSGNYGIGISKFSRDAGIPYHEGKRVLDAYFQMFPGIKRWQMETTEGLRRTRTLRTPYGRVRQFLGAWNTDLVNEGLAYVPQSTVADVLNQGLMSYFRDEKGQILLQVHDSIMVQCHLGEEADRVKEALLAHLRQPVVVGGRECVIPVDIKVGESWDALH